MPPPGNQLTVRETGRSSETNKHNKCQSPVRCLSQHMVPRRVRWPPSCAGEISTANDYLPHFQSRLVEKIHHFLTGQGYSPQWNCGRKCCGRGRLCIDEQAPSRTVEKSVAVSSNDASETQSDSKPTSTETNLPSTPVETVKSDTPLTPTAPATPAAAEPIAKKKSVPNMARGWSLGVPALRFRSGEYAEFPETLQKTSGDTAEFTVETWVRLVTVQNHQHVFGNLSPLNVSPPFSGWALQFVNDFQNGLRLCLLYATPDNRLLRDETKPPLSRPSPFISPGARRRKSGNCM